jgi:hypothetical protein
MLNHTTELHIGMLVDGIPANCGCGVDVYFRLFPRPLETALRLAWQGQVYTTRGPDSICQPDIQGTWTC